MATISQSVRMLMRRVCEILNQKEDLILSDNYFDLNADSKTVKVISGSVDKLRLRSVYDIS